MSEIRTETKIYHGWHITLSHDPDKREYTLKARSEEQSFGPEVVPDNNPRQIAAIMMQLKQMLQYRDENGFQNFSFSF